MQCRFFSRHLDPGDRRHFITLFYCGKKNENEESEEIKEEKNNSEKDCVMSRR